MYIPAMRNINQIILLIVYLLAANRLGSQTPTHIDQGTTDDKVYLSENPGYIFAIVALLIILAVWYLILRKRKKNRK
jgi:LPXTG-motif cell wall-anchored protein